MTQVLILATAFAGWVLINSAIFLVCLVVYWCANWYNTDCKKKVKYRNFKLDGKKAK